MLKLAHIMMGYSCNSHCQHCVVQVKRGKAESNENGNDLATSEILERIDLELARGANEIVLTGGEPTIRKDILEIIQQLKDKRVKIQIQTNGTMTEVIKQIVGTFSQQNANRLSFMIPLHSCNPEINDHISQLQGSFYKANKSIVILTQNRIPVIGKIVYTNYTDNLEAIVNFYVSLGVQKIIIAYPHCVSFTDEMVRKVAPRLNKVKDALLFLVASKHRNIVSLQGFPLCVVHKMFDTVQECDPNYLKEVHMEIQYTDAKLLWNDYRKRDKRKFKVCSSCRYDQQCEGIWKEYLRVYGEDMSGVIF